MKVAPRRFDCLADASRNKKNSRFQCLTENGCFDQIIVNPCIGG